MPRLDAWMPDCLGYPDVKSLGMKEQRHAGCPSTCILAFIKPIINITTNSGNRLIERSIILELLGQATFLTTHSTQTANGNSSVLVCLRSSCRPASQTTYSTFFGQYQTASTVFPAIPRSRSMAANTRFCDYSARYDYAYMFMHTHTTSRDSG